MRLSREASVLSQFETFSIKPEILSTSCAVVASPASIAGVTRNTAFPNIARAAAVTGSSTARITDNHRQSPTRLRTVPLMPCSCPGMSVWAAWTCERHRKAQSVGSSLDGGLDREDRLSVASVSYYEKDGYYAKDDPAHRKRVPGWARARRHWGCRVRWSRMRSRRCWKAVYGAGASSGGRTWTATSITGRAAMSLFQRPPGRPSCGGRPVGYPIKPATRAGTQLATLSSRAAAHPNSR